MRAKSRHKGHEALGDSEVIETKKHKVTVRELDFTTLKHFLFFSWAVAFNFSKISQGLFLHVQ